MEDNTVKKTKKKKTEKNKNVNISKLTIEELNAYLFAIEKVCAYTERINSVNGSQYYLQSIQDNNLKEEIIAANDILLKCNSKYGDIINEIIKRISDLTC